jgi:hypothetical protein
MTLNQNLSACTCMRARELDPRPLVGVLTRIPYPKLRCGKLSIENTFYSENILPRVLVLCEVSCTTECRRERRRMEEANGGTFTGCGACGEPKGKGTARLPFATVAVASTSASTTQILMPTAGRGLYASGSLPLSTVNRARRSRRGVSTGPH